VLWILVTPFRCITRFPFSFKQVQAGGRVRRTGGVILPRFFDPGRISREPRLNSRLRVAGNPNPYAAREGPETLPAVFQGRGFPLMNEVSGEATASITDTKGNTIFGGKKDVEVPRIGR